ncbi:GNAT family N-acetyltransferase [Actinoallomurus rhizosphaericola]|uniref:GNAT family N-acetyltransferase n=1 Tax=Actinoallomurus rhizosphaericola TaxID=2952536 RepID=UPI0020911D69|nr:GNAT family N-acetyltransferase [Actinoallomurus rhizosphaericola]MCO5994643.1 GNAT family N-acetyltransferase [Actinoallomurus rhizosphaericola]
MILRTATAEEAARLAPYLPVTHAVLDGDRLAGGLSLIEARPGVREVSVWVIPEERRRGVASKALRTLTEQADGRLEMITDVVDTVSQRVALNAGFTRESVRRGSGPEGGGRPDEVVWAWLPGDPAGPSPRPLPDLRNGELRDGEVSLRPLGPADADDLWTLMNLPDVRHRSLYTQERPRADIVRRCERAASEWLAGNRADFVIRVGDAFAGDIGLYNEAWSRQAMVGYSMLPEFRGRGVATRAVRLVSAWAFEIGVQRLVAGTMTDNVASQRVLEKAGFVRESVQRSRFDRPDGTRADDVLHVLLP